MSRLIKTFRSSSGRPSKSPFRGSGLVFLLSLGFLLALSSPSRANTLTPPQGEKPPAAIRLGGKTVYEVRASRRGEPPAKRALTAQKALKEAVASDDELPIRVERAGEEEVIYLGSHPWLRLAEADRALAGDPSLRVHSDTVAGRLRDAVTRERSRIHLATRVFSISLVVFSTLIALYLLGKTSELSAIFRAWVGDRKKKLPSLSVQNFEVVGPGAVRGAVEVGIEASKWLSRALILYLWFFVTFSQFTATRGYVDALTGSFLAPVGQLFARLTSTVPLAAIGLVGVLVLALLLRFIGIFFEGVYAGDTSLTWLDRDLARPTGVLVRIALLLSALLFVAPLVSGNTDGVFPRTALIFLAVTGLAAMPVLSSCIVGVSAIYRRTLRPGEWLTYGGQTGKVHEVTLLAVFLAPDGTTSTLTKVPHVLSFLHPTVHHGAVRLHRIVVPVASAAPGVIPVLRQAAEALSSRASARLVQVTVDALYYEVQIYSDQQSALEELHQAVYDALAKAQIPWVVSGSGARS